MKIAAYWISFEPPPDWIRAVADELYIKNVFHVPAVRADEHPDWIASRASSDAFAIGKGAAGCLLAHRDAWKMISGSVRDNYALILESDAIPTDYGRRYTARTLQAATRLGANILQVGSNRSEAKGHGKGSRVGSLAHDVVQLAETKILALRSPRFHQRFAAGSHSYLVSSEYCKWLKSWKPDFKIPVDQWLHALARDPRHLVFRTRQDLWRASSRPSEIEHIGRW